MNGQMFLRPGKPGMLVRDPHTKRALPADGAWVQRNSYWLRRVASGDAIEGTPSAIAAPAKEAK